MLHNPDEQALFPSLPIDRIREMCPYGEEVQLAAGEVLFEEGSPKYPFCIVLEGHLRVTKRISGEEALLVVHGPGHFIGEISILTGAPALVTARAEGRTKILRFSGDEFLKLITECPQVARTVLHAFAARSREVAAYTVQQEKLASLGKLAAGLAHELNNPAAALVRSAASLRDALVRFTKLGLQYDCRLIDDQRPTIASLQSHLRSRATNPDTLTPLERSDREEALAEWLDRNGIANGWEMASSLVEAGLTRGCLDGLNGQLASDALAAALTWIEADLATSQVSGEIESAARNISELVQAMKEYTYMDRAQFQVIDVHTGLDATLRIFGHRMKKGVQVKRNYDRSLPRVCAYAGELNQAWTNLISNALDAMHDAGVLTVSTWRDGDQAVVTIGDNGPGLSPEVREHLFEPFYTTKPAGKGTGLGLEIVSRIVVNRHHGKIEVESQPGETRFIVRLPFVQPKDHEMYSHQPDSESEPALERV